MNIKTIFASLLVCLMLSACSSSKKVLYFQDLTPGETQSQITSSWDIRIRPNDKIAIYVNSKDPLLMSLFNLPTVSRSIGSSSGVSSTSQGVASYTVDREGNIDFPVLGTIHVEGLTREEIVSYIKNELISKNLVKDPVVTVEFVNLAVSVLGEVVKPGRYSIDKDRVTILDALSMAGDLTIFGKRDKVMVLREESGVQKVYGVNLLSAEQVYSSPVYYLQQNDVVYVEPNGTKARESTVNGNNIRSASFWISLASLITSVTLIFVY